MPEESRMEGLQPLASRRPIPACPQGGFTSFQAFQKYWVSGQASVLAALPSRVYLKSRWRSHVPGEKPGPVDPDRPIRAISLLHRDVAPFGNMCGVGSTLWPNRPETLGQSIKLYFRARVAPHLSFRIHLSVGCQAVLDFSWPLSAKGEEAGLVSVGEYIPLPETLSRPFLRAPLQKRAEKASVSGLSFLSRVFTFSMQRLSGSNRQIGLQVVPPRANSPL